MKVTISVADKQTLDTVKNSTDAIQTTTEETKTSVNSLKETIGTPASGENILSKLQTIEANTSGGTDLSTVNSNMEKPLNVQLIEQTWAMGMTDESMSWGFRQEGYVGTALWFYGELWKHNANAMAFIAVLLAAQK